MIGSLEFPPGLILPDSTASPGEENKISYQALPGVHGVDRFEYAQTDCLGFGASSPVTVSLPTPAGPFESPPFLSIVHTLPDVLQGNGNDVTTSVEYGRYSISVDVNRRPFRGALSLHELLSGAAPVTVEFQGATGDTGSFSSLQLHNGAVLSRSNRSVELTSREWVASQVWVGEGAEGTIELWFSNPTSPTYRVQITVRPPHLGCASGYVRRTRGNDASLEYCQPCSP